MRLFEHDLRANAFRVCREGTTFPDHALEKEVAGIERVGGDILQVDGIAAGDAEPDAAGNRGVAQIAFANLRAADATKTSRARSTN